jgi:hypothetical protein
VPVGGPGSDTQFWCSAVVLALTCHVIFLAHRDLVVRAHTAIANAIVKGDLVIEDVPVQAAEAWLEAVRAQEPTGMRAVPDTVPEVSAMWSHIAYAGECWALLCIVPELCLSFTSHCL